MGVIRKTKSVKEVLQVFEKSADAIAVVELVERLKQHMNKTTVYRILERLEEDGVLHSFAGKNGLRWYAKCTSCTTEKHVDTHPHFQCRDCGKVECVPLDVAIPKMQNHKIETVSLLLTGQCHDCVLKT